MAIPDVLSAVRVLLRADATVTAICPAGQIYAGEMPATEAALQPRAAVVVSLAGGPADRGNSQYGRTRIDVRAYNTTPFEATRLSNQIYESLKHLVRTRVAATTPTLIHSVMSEGGPVALRDQDGDWPFTFRSFEVLAAEIAA